VYNWGKMSANCFLTAFNQFNAKESIFLGLIDKDTFSLKGTSCKQETTLILAFGKFFFRFGWAQPCFKGLFQLFWKKFGSLMRNKNMFWKPNTNKNNKGELFISYYTSYFWTLILSFISIQFALICNSYQWGGY